MVVPNTPDRAATQLDALAARVCADKPACIVSLPAPEVTTYAEALAYAEAHRKEIVVFAPDQTHVLVLPIQHAPATPPSH